MRPFADALRARLARPLPGLDAQLRMAPRPRPGWNPQARPDDLRAAAALILLYPLAGRWCVPLTERGATLRHHTGQVSLPGGRVDADERLEDAALREAFEEVGVVPGQVELLGRLTPLHIPVSRHLLHPIVGLMTTRPAFRPAATEVARLIEVPLALLRAPDTVQHERRRREESGVVMEVPFFAVAGLRVWGATAMVLAEFLAVVDGLDDVPGG